jgi:hypothetical protein
VETTVTSLWLLARVARSEQRVYMEVEFGERQFALLAQVDKQRTHLERSFRTAIEDMKQAQKSVARILPGPHSQRKPSNLRLRHSPNTTPAPGPCQPSASLQRRRNHRPSASLETQPPTTSH